MCYESLRFRLRYLSQIQIWTPAIVKSWVSTKKYQDENNNRSVADPGFSPGGVPTPKSAIIFQFFAENCMKMKEFGPPGGVHPWHPPLDPPMQIVWILTALLGWTPAIVKSLVSISVGHPQFNYCRCPDLNLRQISLSESEAQGIHISCSLAKITGLYSDLWGWPLPPPPPSGKSWFGH